jgi:predicted ATPase
VPASHNLPQPMTPFVGRLKELARVSTWLADPECQIVTITGISGSGKTRLALHVARGFATPGSPPPEQPFPDGIFLIDLAHEGPEGLSRVGSDLYNRSVLLVLDDFDQSGLSTTLLLKLLVQAPGLKLLVTARKPLGVPGERVVQLGGLCLPTDENDIETADASVLYVQEARRRSVGYELPDRERLPLVRLCQMLCGFPLALVLAARWAVVLPCSALIDELQSGAGLDLLATTDGDLPERHRRVTGNLQHAVAGAVSVSNMFVYHASSQADEKSALSTRQS